MLSKQRNKIDGLIMFSHVYNARVVRDGTERNGDKSVECRVCECVSVGHSSRSGQRICMAIF